MYVIEFSDEEITAAEHWHGGQTTMLYAVASTGALMLGTIRPYRDNCGICDTRGRQMTDREWMGALVTRLTCEVRDAIEGCRRLLQRANDTDDATKDLEGLEALYQTLTCSSQFTPVV